MSSQYPEDDEDEEHDQNCQSDGRLVASKGDFKEENLAARNLPGAEALPQESVSGEAAQCTGGVSSISSISLPFGGARPKTKMIPLDTRNRRGNEELNRGADAEAQRGAELRSRLSECELNVQSCDNYDEREESAEGVGRMKERVGRVESRIESRGELRGLNRNDNRVGWSSLPDETEGGEDEFCIYTYKGGTAYLTADLPNSFFRLDSGSDGESLPGVAGAGQSNLSTGVAALIQDQLINAPPPVRSFSPSEDFIEMDFDPGSDVESESSGDSGQGRDGTDMEGDEREEREESSDEEPSPPPVIALPPALVLVEPPYLNNNTLQSKPEAACTSCEEALAPVPSTSSNTLLDLREPALGPAPQTSSAPALSPAEEVPVLLPRSKSLNSSLASCLIFSSEPPTRTANLSLCGSRLLQREARLFGEGETNDNKAGDTVGEDAALVRIVDSLPSLRLGQKAMIWTEKEALRKQVIQLGTSACGATALVNVLQALEIDFPLPQLLEAVDTRLRRPDSSLPDYLLSRSRAGCNHRDLEAGAARVSPRIVTRFFPFHRRSIAVAAWLARWITAGCVPILTLNVQRAVQRPGELPADAWHHQMVWGVADREIYLANPLEMVQERELLPQLDSPSELLVRRSDVVSRCGPETDLLELRDFGEQWRSLNVLGQVVNVLREEKREALEEGGRTLTSHVKIPADYTSGALLCCLEENTEAVRLLKEAPDLQLRK